MILCSELRNLTSKLPSVFIVNRYVHVFYQNNIMYFLSFPCFSSLVRGLSPGIQYLILSTFFCLRGIFHIWLLSISSECVVFCSLFYFCVWFFFYLFICFTCLIRWDLSFSYSSNDYITTHSTANKYPSIHREEIKSNFILF